MKAIPVLCTMLIFSACMQHKDTEPVNLALNYVQYDIHKQFDTLFDHQQVDSGVYKGFIEQAYANCHEGTDSTRTITQDVFSSMYINLSSGKYDCVTTTVFQLPDGTISATGVFNMAPGDTIAPDHDFPITGGSGAYRHVSGTYTRQYRNGVYHVALQYYRSERH